MVTTASVFRVALSMGVAIAALFLESGGDEMQLLQAAGLSSPMLKIKGVAGLPADLLSCRIAADQVAKGGGADFIVTGADYKPKIFKQNEYTQRRERYERLIAQYKSEPSIQLGSPTHGWFANACDAAYRARRQASRVSTPTLVMVAGEDSIVHDKNTGPRPNPLDNGACTSSTCLP